MEKFTRTIPSISVIIEKKEVLTAMPEKHRMSLSKKYKLNRF